MKKIVFSLIITSIIAAPLCAMGTYEFLNNATKQSWQTAVEAVKKNPYKIVFGTSLLISAILLYRAYQQSNTPTTDTQPKQSLWQRAQETRKKELMELCPESYRKELESAFKDPKKYNLKKYAANLSQDDYGCILSLITAYCEKMFALNPNDKGYRFFFKEDKYEASRGYNLNDVLKAVHLDNKITLPKLDTTNIAGTINTLFLKAQEHKIDLKTWIKNHPECFEQLTAQYKIHLMPQQQDLFKDVSKIIARIKQDTNFADSIQTFKVRENIYTIKEHNEIMPLIVIYPKPGKKNAQYVLDTMYEIFNNEQGLDKTPRYNVKVTSKIYWAQGNGDHKGNKIDKDLLDLFYTKDRICYNDLLETGESYALTDPSK